MCALVYDYDYNARCAEYLNTTHEPFFKKIREAHPSLPVIILSAPYNAKDGDDRTRRDIIKATYDNAIANGDKNVYFIDGGSIFEGEFSDACTVDTIHPNDLGFSRIASKLLPVLKNALKIE
jgi:lysophospholipase L1-like esterase